jgi:hypothetical protein
LLRQDIHQGFDFYKLQLKLLNWLRPGKRWALKWPYHLWHLDTLFETFPDATVIYLHRDPCEAIPSVCSLAALARASFCEFIDDIALGKFWLEYSDAGLQRGVASRAKARADQIVDIRYLDLKADPAAVICQILNVLDLETDESWLNALRADLNVEQKRKQKVHHYALSQFGLKPGEMQERFAAYIERYDLGA